MRLILKNVTLGPNDFMLFRDGLQDNSSQIVEYTDCAAGELKLYSTNRYALVRYVSNGSEAVSDFRLDYESVSSGKKKKISDHFLVIYFSLLSWLLVEIHLVCLCP